MKWSDYCAHRNQIENIELELILPVNFREGGVFGDLIKNQGRVSLHQKDAQSLESVGNHLTWAVNSCMKKQINVNTKVCVSWTNVNFDIKIKFINILHTYYTDIGNKIKRNKMKYVWFHIKGTGSSLLEGITSDYSSD